MSIGHWRWFNYPMRFSHASNNGINAFIRLQVRHKVVHHTRDDRDDGEDALRTSHFMMNDIETNHRDSHAERRLQRICRFYKAANCKSRPRRERARAFEKFMAQNGWNSERPPSPRAVGRREIAITQNMNNSICWFYSSESVAPPSMPHTNAETLRANGKMVQTSHSALSIVLSEKMIFNG